MKLSNLIALLTNRTVAGNAYVKDGELYQGNTSQAILVKNENELSEVKKHVAPGSIAYTAGYASVWQLDASGTWQEIQEEGGGGFSPDITNPQDGDTLVYNATAGKWVNGSGGGEMVLTVTKDVVGSNTYCTLNKTWKEIKDALAAGTQVVLYGEGTGENAGVYARFTVGSVYANDGMYLVSNISPGIDSYEAVVLGTDDQFTATSEDGYPVAVIHT